MSNPEESRTDTSGRTGFVRRESRQFDPAAGTAAALLLIAFLVLALLAGLGTAAYFERVSVPAAAAIVIFGGVTIVVASRLVTALAEDETVSFDSSWGGLGGARGGWRMSAPLGYLAALLVSGLLLMGVVVVEMNRTVDASPASNSAEEADSSMVGGTEED